MAAMEETDDAVVEICVGCTNNVTNHYVEESSETRTSDNLGGEILSVPTGTDPDLQAFFGCWTGGWYLYADIYFNEDMTWEKHENSACSDYQPSTCNGSRSYDAISKTAWNHET